MADLNSIEQILSEIKTDINNITSNSNTSNANNGASVIDYTTLLSKIDGTTDTIFSNVKNIKDNVLNMSTYLKDSAKYLKDIDDHIKGFSSIYPTPQNATGGTPDFSNIESTVKGIYDEIRKFHNDYVTAEKNRLQENLTPNERKKKQLDDEELRKQNRKREAEKILKDPKSTKKEKKAAAKRLEEYEKEDERYSNYLKNRKKFSGKNIATSAINASSTIIKGDLKSSDILDKGVGALTQINPIIGAIAGLFKAGLDSFAKEQEYGSKYARSYGGGRFAMDEYMQKSARFRLDSDWSRGYTKDEFFEALSAYNDQTGRSGSHLTNENISSAIDLKRMGIGMESMNIFDTFGKSIQDVDKYFEDMYGKAGKKGLSFKSVSKAVKDNLKMAQTYTFANGLKGLTKMAETSTQLKFSMNEVAKAAEKVSTLEGAVHAGAGLSVLGGEFANFANPMQMMYEGLNDMEGLQDRIVNMFGDMAYFDREKQQIDISAYDKQRIRSASSALGVDYGEMLNLAMNNQRGKMVENQLKGANVDKDTMQYIKNIAQINDEGRAYVMGKDNKEIFLDNRSQFNKDEIDYFKNESERKASKENASIGDVYMTTQNIYEKFDKYLASISEKLGALVVKIVGGSAKMSNSQAGYWNSLTDEEKNDLKQKYNLKNDRQLKARIATGLENDAIAEQYGGEDRVNFIDSNSELYNKRKWWGWGKNGIMPYFMKNFNEYNTNENFENYLISQNKNNNELRDLGGINRRKGWSNMTWKGGEGILNENAVKNIGEENVEAFNHGDYSAFDKQRIKAAGNILNTLKVSPTAVSSSPQKISFDPMNINLSGKFELTSGGKNKSINLDDLDKNELKKLIMDIVKSSTPQINKQLMTLKDKGYNMEKDPYRGSGGYVL